MNNLFNLGFEKDITSNNKTSIYKYKNGNVGITIHIEGVYTHIEINKEDTIIEIIRKTDFRKILDAIHEYVDLSNEN